MSVLDPVASPLGAARVASVFPGPASRAYLERQAAYESNARSYPRRLPLAIRRAHGSLVEDLDGNVFIDFLSGAGSLPLGHAHPALLRAVHEQLDVLTHGLDFPTPVREEFVRELIGLLPAAMRGRTKIGFCGPAGADAVDAALKLCKTATGRADVISFHGGFHGNTQSTMAVTGLRASKEHLGNLMPGVQFFPYAYCYRCPVGLKPSSCEINCVQYLEKILDDANGGVRKPAAVIMEVLQGEGGSIPAHPQFVREVRRITRRLDIPLIVDEIQSGCGRTGAWYAFEHHGIEPDVIVTSKALGGLGLPVAAILYDERLDTWAPGSHTGTFRGNQLAFAGGAAFMKILREEGLLEKVARDGIHATAYLDEALAGLAAVGDVRGTGLMMGIELIDPNTGAGDPALAGAVQEAALRAGLIVELGGRDDCVVRLLPALNIERSLLDQGLAILAAAIRSASTRKKAELR